MSYAAPVICSPNTLVPTDLRKQSVRAGGIAAVSCPVYRANADLLRPDALMRAADRPAGTCVSDLVGEGAPCVSLPRPTYRENP